MKTETNGHDRQDNGDVDQTPIGDDGQSGWLTAREAAFYAGSIGISTVRDACNRKELRHVRVGGGARGPIRIRKEWIDEWLEAWARGGEVA